MREESLVYLHEGSRWLFLLRNKKKEDLNEGKWIGVGGKKEVDETMEECAIRETQEETGLILDELIYKGQVDFFYEDQRPERMMVYTSKQFHGTLKECDEGELRWIEESDIPSLNLWEGDRVFLPFVLQEESKPFSIVLKYDTSGKLVQSYRKGNIMSKPVIIGIAGGSASGKTSISQKIKETFQNEKSVVLLRQDDYYKDQSEKPFEERLKTNYDHPFAFENTLLIEHLKMLIEGKAIQKPTYDFVHHTRSDIVETIYPADVIILEGLFVLEDEDLRKLENIKVYVDTPSDIRFIRRLLRDVNERGRSVENIVKQYTDTVRIMHESFIEPTKKYADIIIPEGASNTVAIDLLTTKISSVIHHDAL